MNIKQTPILEALIRMVEHISNREYQKKSWIEGEGADFDEAVCLFFGYCDPVLDSYQDYGLSKHQYQTLKVFRDEFEEFSDDNSWPPSFIDTPEWAKIMDRAKEVLDAFN